MARIVSTPIDDIDPNPFRNLADYPYKEDKLEVLAHSIHDVGLWEGVVGRKNGNRIEIAFGHHRIEAARRAGLKKVPIIVRDLSDTDMLQFMARENAEDYNADFSAMYETWEAARRFGHVQPDIDVGRLLGMVVVQKREDRPNDSEVLTAAGRACAEAYRLINETDLDRDDFANLGIRAAYDVVTGIGGSFRRIDSTNLPERQKEERKRMTIAMARHAIGQYLGGLVRVNQLRSMIAMGEYGDPDKEEFPDFKKFAERLIAKIAKVVESDTISRDIDRVLKEIPHIESDEDRSWIDAIRMELGTLAERAEKQRQRFEKKTSAKVVQIKEVS